MHVLPKEVIFVTLLDDGKRRVHYADGEVAIIALAPITTKCRFDDHDWRKSLWRRLLDDDGLVYEQFRWEQRHKMRQMRNLGFTYDEIGKYWLLNATTVSKFVHKQRHDVHNISPINRWISKKSDFITAHQDWILFSEQLDNL